MVRGNTHIHNERGMGWRRLQGLRGGVEVKDRHEEVVLRDEEEDKVQVEEEKEQNMDRFEGGGGWRNNTMS